MIKIQIVNDGVRGADDGATVRDYPKNGGPNKDGVYTVSIALAEALIASDDAREVVEKKQTVTERLKAKAGKAEKEAAEKAAAEPAPAPAPEPVPRPRPNRYPRPRPNLQRSKSPKPSFPAFRQFRSRNEA